jgi:hypothetical protein
VLDQDDLINERDRGVAPRSFAEVIRTADRRAAATFDRCGDRGWATRHFRKRQLLCGVGSSDLRLRVPRSSMATAPPTCPRGLADMHVHSDTAEDMKIYLANGVTTVLNMGHASEGFMDQMRPAINSGKLPGPHIYTGLLVDGSPQFGNLFVTTPAQARAIVDIARTNGYDFIKVYNDLSPACFEAIIGEGKRQHIRVIGHGVTRVGIEKQLAMGQIMVAHTEEFLYTVFSHPDLSASNPAVLDPTPPKTADIPRVIALTPASRAISSTLICRARLVVMKSTARAKRRSERNSVRRSLSPLNTPLLNREAK